VGTESGVDAIHREHAAAGARVNTSDNAPSVIREPRKVGLCERCIHARRIPSSRGSIFYLCELSEMDTSFPRYPRLPVLQCPGFLATETSIGE